MQVQFKSFQIIHQKYIEIHSLQTGDSGIYTFNIWNPRHPGDPGIHTLHIGNPRHPGDLGIHTLHIEKPRYTGDLGIHTLHTENPRPRQTYRVSQKRGAKNIA